MSEWIDARHEVPPEAEQVLVIATLNVAGTEIENYALAFYTREGWILEDLDQESLVGVRYWIPLPDMPEEVNL